MSSRKPKSIKATKARAYVGLWNSGTPGWIVPNFINESDYPEILNTDMNLHYASGQWAYLCEVTIKPIKIDGKYKRRKVK